MIFKNKTIRRLDQMLEEGIRGEFRESRYDESQLSRLEIFIMCDHDNGLAKTFSRNLQKSQNILAGGRIQTS